MSDNVIVIDNFYKTGPYEELFKELHAHKFKYFWGDMSGSLYWNSQIDLSEDDTLSKLVDNHWNQFKDKFSNVGTLGRIYINGQTYGLEPGAHYDHTEEKAITVVNYITDSWNATWGGETVLYDNFASKDEYGPSHVEKVLKSSLRIDEAVLPAYNRILLFPANQLHVAKPLGRFFPGIRCTLMYKLTGLTIEELMEGYKS
jgi:hypothetical protein